MLDAGAQGIIIPMVNSAEEAVRAVDAANIRLSDKEATARPLLAAAPEASARSTTQLRMTPTRVYQ